ncbi:receptor-interacting serine/threonine-protein kinase 1-like [Branchiostoma floridae x Branchiostoma japonicum]
MDDLVTTKQLDYVAGNILKDPKCLLRDLGLKDTTIDQGYYDYEKDGIREKLYQGLHKWKEQKDDPPFL